MTSPRDLEISARRLDDPSSSRIFPDQLRIMPSAHEAVMLLGRVSARGIVYVDVNGDYA